MKKFTIQQMRAYLLTGRIPGEATELDLQRAIAETLSQLERKQSEPAPIETRGFTFSCIGCRTPFSDSKMQAYVDMIGSGDPEQMRKFDYHCERCARAESLRRQVLPAESGSMFVLTAFDIDMVSASGFQLGRADPESLQMHEDHYVRVLAASLIRKVEMDSLATEPVNKPNLKIVVDESMPEGEISLRDPNGIERLRVTGIKEEP